MTREQYVDSRYETYFHEELSTALVVGPVFLLCPIALDYFAAPQHFRAFLAYRLAAFGVLCVLYLANRRQAGTGRQVAISLVALSTVTVMLSAMTFAFRGHQSPYAMGIVVLLILGFGFVPLPFRFALPAGLLMYAVYGLPIVLFDTITDVPAMLSTNVLMLSCLGALLLLRYFNEKRLLGEFGLHYEVEQYKSNLELLVAERTALLSNTVGRLEAEVEERRRVERELRTSTDDLRASRSLYEQVVSMISDTVWRYEVDAAGGFVDSYISPVAERMLDLPEGTLNHDFERYFSQVHPEDLPVVEQALMGGIRSRAKDVNVEYRLRRRNGDELWVRSSGSAHVGFGGNVLAIGTTSDITQRKAVEAERLKRQKLEAVGTLAGGIAHDFNNLLQGVFGYISLARMFENDRGKRTAALEQAENALQLSVKLSNQLLTFSKGGLPVKKVVDLRPVVEVYAKFGLSGSNSVLRASVSDELWQVEADDGQIGQVIQNMVLNAAQAMPGGGTVELACRNVPVDGAQPANVPRPVRYVQIAITDTGTGIPGGDLELIFDPYFTTKEKGSGLGLATSYSIVRNHNGWIDVKSSPGNGTTFFINLPAAEASARGASLKAGAPAATPPGRVLVMDDDPHICDVAGELLRELGHDVVLAAEGGEAVAKYVAARESGAPFTAVILDLTIRGGMGGEETIRRLRQFDPAVKAIVSSGYSDDSVIANYAEHGFRAFLRKPYHLDELRDILTTFTTA